MNEQAAPQTKELKGIGGWLLFYVILICIWIVLMLVSWLALESLVKQHPQLAPVVSASRIMFIILLVLAVAQLVVIFMKMKWVPMGIVVLLSIGIVINILSLILAKAGSPSNLVGGLASIVISCLWIGYFTKSVRVKNTFVK
jgi:hypothetical protein